MIEFVKDDLLNAKEDFICHQVNCKGVMGAGVAKQISDKYPQVKYQYQERCRLFKPDEKYELLGKVQTVKINDRQYVLNIFGQFNYGRDKNHTYTSYPALMKAMKTIRLPGKTYAFPNHFACGLAGGNWDTVLAIIEKTLAYDHKVVIYVR